MLPARYSPVTHAGSVCACPVTVLPKSGVNNQERRLYLPSAILQHISFSVMLLWCQAPARHSPVTHVGPCVIQPQTLPQKGQLNLGAAAAPCCHCAIQQLKTARHSRVTSMGSASLQLY